MSCVLQEQGLPAADVKRSLTTECSIEIFRLIKAQTSAIQLDANLFDACLNDLGTFCGGIKERGHEHECLQTNFEKLQVDFYLLISVVVIPLTKTHYLIIGSRSWTFLVVRCGAENLKVARAESELKLKKW